MEAVCLMGGETDEHIIHSVFDGREKWMSISFKSGEVEEVGRWRKWGGGVGRWRKWGGGGSEQDSSLSATCCSPSPTAASHPPSRRCPHQTAPPVTNTQHSFQSSYSIHFNHLTAFSSIILQHSVQSSYSIHFNHPTHSIHLNHLTAFISNIQHTAFSSIILQHSFQTSNTQHLVQSSNTLHK